MSPILKYRKKRAFGKRTQYLIYCCVYTKKFTIDNILWNILGNRQINQSIVDYNFMSDYFHSLVCSDNY